MRREFILVLLGIICVSTLSSILSNYVPIETDKFLLDTVVGVVGAGNISYWQLGHTGPLLVELTSLSGDADLYVSDNLRPSYEPEKNNFSSITCGPDIVYIPADFPRPVGIGVFGHWSHFASEYSIQVFLDTSAVFSNHLLSAQRPEVPDIRADPENKQSKDKPAPRKDLETRPKFLRVFDLFADWLLDAIVEIFVL